MSDHNSPDPQPNEPEERTAKLNQKFVIKLTKQSNKIVAKSLKQCCKVLQISSELDIDQKLAAIRALEPLEYPNLFVFIIVNDNENIAAEKTQQLKELLIKFNSSRPLIILQKYEAENKTKFYYKEENSPQLVDIDQHYSVDHELYEEWKESINSLLDQDLEPFEDEILKKLSCIKDSSIVLRFLRTLNLKETFFESIVIKIVENGSKAVLLAVLDASFEDNGRMLNDQAQNYIRYVFEDEESPEAPEASEASDDENIEVNSDIGEDEPGSEDDQDDLKDEAVLKPKKADSIKSVLLTAVNHSNQEIINYLISYCSDLIQQLPKDHQIRISTDAYELKQLDVLSDLLECSDFPFPEDFHNKIDELNHERLQQITNDRVKFHDGIKQENYGDINNFINNNCSLKFIYSVQNTTAMKEAYDSQKYKLYYYLKSFGFYGSSNDDLSSSEAKAQANLQINETIDEALRINNKSVFILYFKSLIHNRKVKKEDETKYRKHIKKWLEDIYKVADTMLDVAATCENLVIVFDFESKFVDRTAFFDNSLGLSYTTTSSRIFIGTKLGDREREQEIKGVLAHELCHYVMCIVYNNTFLPYYKYAKDIRDQFDEIVKSIDKWSGINAESPNDECNGIISSVFLSYDADCFHLELIVRAVHILALYDDNPEHCADLQEKYRILFDFWFTFVVPEMQKHLQKNTIAIRVNTTVGLLSSLSELQIEFSVEKDMEQLIGNKIVIVTTNVPKLLFINIYKHLQEKIGSLLDSQNIFMEVEKINNKQVKKDLEELHKKKIKLNVFVDCCKDKLDNLSSILNIKVFNFILIASSEERSKYLKTICRKRKRKITSVDAEINYKWADLTDENQTKLMQTKVAFQNSETSLLELLSKTPSSDQNEILEDFSNIIDDHLMNLLIDQTEITINSNAEDDSKSKKIETLYQDRKFLRKGVSFKNEISQEKLISITEDNKYVLISDIAGSGKSWVVKNIIKIIKQRNPTRWVTYVDLKEFIKEFKKPVQDFEFVNYFVEKILKPKTKFEEEIFKKLYKNGKVSIIFDAFDEIAPDCAELVANLTQIFKFNDRNQLWIVTRDYFEVNLQQKLGIKNIYKLAEFLEEDGINFIVTSWILTDLNDQRVYDFEKYVKSSPNLTKYQEKARKIVQKVTTTKSRFIGLPQLFSMIADGFKGDSCLDDKLDDLKGAKIFENFVNAMYTRWADHKGIISKKTSVQIQHNDLNFIEIHQYCAIASLFLEFLELLFPGYNKVEWPEAKVIACGIMNKFGSFIHETFREFFVADFLIKQLKKSTIKKEVLDLLIQVLTIQKYGIIRMFLNDFIDIMDRDIRDSTLEKLQSELEKSVEKFQSMENISEYFTENQEHLAKLVIEILKKGDNEKVKKILLDNIEAVATKTKELEMFSMFIEFLFSYLNDEDLTNMINGQSLLQKMIGPDIDVEIFKYFLLKLEEKLGQKFIQQELKLMATGPENGNIFYHLGTSQNLSENKVKKFFEIIQKYFNDSEIVELMDTCNHGGQPITYILVENTRNFAPFVDGTESLLNDKNLFRKIKNIVCKTDLKDEHILHRSANKDEIEFHSSLWHLIQKMFVNQKELAAFVLQTNKSKNTFLYLLIISNKSDIIGFTLKKLKEILKESDYQEILRSKGDFGRNLLQVAAVESKEVKTHQILWKEIRETCKSDEEFFEILGECEEDGDNVLGLAATFSTGEILKFMQQELEKLGFQDKVKKLLTNLGFARRHLLQAAALQNNSVELHEVIWKILENYFNSSEILHFAQYRDIFGHNVLLSAIEENTKEVKELTLTKVKQHLNSNDLITEEHKKNIQKCEKIMKSSSGVNQLGIDDVEILKLKWIKNENSEASKLFDEAIQKLIDQKLKEINLENIEIFMADENIENHKKLWENLVKINKDRKIIENLSSEVDKNGNNFLHLLVIYNSSDVIALTLNNFKDNLGNSDYDIMLRSKGQFGRNLLQLAAVSSKEVKTHQILWKELRDSCKSEEEFLQILEEVDKNGVDVFNLAASFTSGEVFEFLLQGLAKIASVDKIKNFLTKKGIANRNLIQAAAGQNKSLKLHEMLWKILQQYFDSSEILEFFKHFDDYGKNLLINAMEFSTKNILELTWMEVKKVLTELYKDPETLQNIEKCEKIIQKIAEKKENENKIKDGKIYIKWKELEFLKLNWIKSMSGSSKLNDELSQSVLEINLNIKSADDLKKFVNIKNISHHEKLWSHLLTSSKSCDFLTELISKKDKNGNNFIHLLVIYNSADVIEFTFKNIKENFIDSDFQEILRSKGQFGRNLLQLAAANSKEVQTHQILWKELRKSCKTDDEFLEILGECDEDGDNPLGLAATFSTGEILKFMQQELEKLGFQDKVKKLLTNLGFARRHLLQAAAQQNEDLELHKMLWKILEKYFDPPEILHFAQHRDIYGDNVLLSAIEKNTKEVKEFTWNKVRNALINNKYEDNENFKKCDELMKKDKTFKELTKEEKEILNLKWINSSNSDKLFEDSIQLVIQKKISVKSLNDLKLFMTDKNVENHEILWKHFDKNFNNYDDFKKLLFETNENGSNFIHLLVILNSADVIEFTLKKIKENFIESDFQEILRSKGHFGRNLLQLAACASKEVKTHQILWKEFKNSCKSNDKFLIFLKEVDDEGSNVFHLAACFTSSEVFEFMISELEIINQKEVKIILRSFGKGNKNLLQSLVIDNKNLETHKTVWIIICKHFDAAEVLEFIEHRDIDEENLLCCAVSCNTKEIVEFTWNQIKVFINTKEGQIEYLNQKGQQGKNLHQLSLENRANDSLVAVWVQQITEEYEFKFPK